MNKRQEVRVIAPSHKWEAGFEYRDERAKVRLESLGYKVTYGKYLKSEFHLGTASAEDRRADLHEALTDSTVAVVLAYTGGWSVNELLPLIDWDLVKSHPKPIVGFSDNSVLANAIFAKTGLVGWVGPDFRALGEDAGWEYTLEHFRLALSAKRPQRMEPSSMWSSQDGGKRFSTKWTVVQEGLAEGTLLGGNFYSYHLLQGTPYQPRFDRPYILAGEIDDETDYQSPRHFSRMLESILQLPGARENLCGMIIGRFVNSANFTDDQLASVIESKRLGSVPVIANLDFGHTQPSLTLPIGGRIRVLARGRTAELELL